MLILNYKFKIHKYLLIFFFILIFNLKLSLSKSYKNYEINMALD